jgi:hypothetical protein
MHNFCVITCFLLHDKLNFIKEDFDEKILLLLLPERCGTAAFFKMAVLPALPTLYDR